MICDEEVTTGVTTINIITVTGYEIRWSYYMDLMVVIELDEYQFSKLFC